MILENRGFLTLEDVYVSSIDFYNQVKDKRWPILHAESSHSISYVKRQLLKLVVYCNRLSNAFQLQSAKV